MLTLSTVRNIFLHLFNGKSSLKLWRWLLLLSSSTLKTSCIARSTESLWDHPYNQPLPISLLVTMNLNFSRPLPSRYVDYTFVVFSNENESNLFLDSLNPLQSFLRFNFEKEPKLALPFQNVLVEKSPSKFITSIYWKPTFSGQYLRWNSFSPQKRKANFSNLILTLAYRALAICSSERLQSKLDKIKFILQTNAYLEHVIKSF